jgi:CRP/FNR family transcriptional regulator, anaerobic regulatory protein
MDLVFLCPLLYLYTMYQDEYSLLKAFISNFIEVTEDEWSLHRDALTRRFLKKGEYLLREGQVCEHVSFVTKGYLRVYSMINDEEISNYFFFENNYATDYASFLTRKPSHTSIIAMEEVEVLQLNYNNMQMLYEKVPSWQKYGRLMAENVFLIAEGRAKTLQHNSPESLYIKIMQEMPQVIERVPLQYIASYMGIQPESLSRIRKRLMEEKRVS